MKQNIQGKNFQLGLQDIVYQAAIECCEMRNNLHTTKTVDIVVYLPPKRSIGDKYA